MAEGLLRSALSTQACEFASVASAGDVNHDGFADVIVGAGSNGAGGSAAGRAYVYFGGRTIDGTVDLTLTGAAAGDLFGSAVAGAGDVNGDGFADVLRITPSRIELYLGSRAGLSRWRRR